MCEEELIFPGYWERTGLKGREGAREGEVHGGQGCTATLPSCPTTQKEFLKTLTVKLQVAHWKILGCQFGPAVWVWWDVPSLRDPVLTRNRCTLARGRDLFCACLPNTRQHLGVTNQLCLLVLEECSLRCLQSPVSQVQVETAPWK